MSLFMQAIFFGLCSNKDDWGPSVLYFHHKKGGTKFCNHGKSFQLFSANSFFLLFALYWQPNYVDVPLCKFLFPNEKRHQLNIFVGFKSKEKCHWQREGKKFQFQASDIAHQKSFFSLSADTIFFSLSNFCQRPLISANWDVSLSAVTLRFATQRGTPIRHP